MLLDVHKDLLARDLHIPFTHSLLFIVKSGGLNEKTTTTTK